MNLLHRIARAARLKHHELALRQARRMLASAASERDWTVVRDRVFELEYCPDPTDCACLEAKPLRKLVSG